MHNEMPQNLYPSLNMRASKHRKMGMTGHVMRIYEYMNITAHEAPVEKHGSKEDNIKFYLFTN